MNIYIALLALVIVVPGIDGLAQLIKIDLADLNLSNNKLRTLGKGKTFLGSLRIGNRGEPNNTVRFRNAYAADLIKTVPKDFVDPAIMYDFLMTNPDVLPNPLCPRLATLPHGGKDWGKCLANVTFGAGILSKGADAGGDYQEKIVLKVE